MKNKKNSSTSILIYGDYLSQPTRSVVAFCKINDISFEFKFINIAKGDHLTQEYSKINELKKIPAVLIKTEDGKEFYVSESCTILRFLSNYYEVDEKWYPRLDMFRRAKIDQWLDWHHLNTRYALSNYVFGKVFAKKIKANIKLNDTYEMVGKVLSFLNKILQKRKFIVDNEISIADLIIACEINQIILTDYDLTNFPSLVEYLNSINSIDSLKEVNQTFESIASKVSIKLNKPKF